VVRFDQESVKRWSLKSKISAGVLAGWDPNYGNAVTDIPYAHGAGAHDRIGAYADALLRDCADSEPCAVRDSDLPAKVRAGANMHAVTQLTVMVYRCASIYYTAKPDAGSGIYDSPGKNNSSLLQKSISAYCRFGMQNAGQSESQRARAFQERKSQRCVAQRSRECAVLS
jgi:hypothetical protein